jgi:hypothetical protein
MTAAAAMTATAAMTAAAAAAVAATAAAAMTATGGVSLAEPGFGSVLIVENVERRQADVGNLFLAERDFVIRRGRLQRHIRGRCSC